MPQYSFGTSTRQPINLANQVPGPGIYNADKKKTGAGVWGFGTGHRQPLSRPTTAPGPGAYNYGQKVIEGPQYSMVPRREDMRGTMANPGPGTYTFKVEAYKTKDPVWGMGTGMRKPLSRQERVPGPGSYKHQGGFGGPQWGFGSSSRAGRQPNDGVGPGYYNIPTTVAVVPRYNMPNTSRT